MTLPFRPARPLAFLAAFADAEALIASGTLTTKNASARDEGRKVLGALLTEIGQERECGRMSQERVEALLRAALADSAAVVSHVAATVGEPAAEPPAVEPAAAPAPVVEDDTAEITTVEPAGEPEPEPTIELEIAPEPEPAVEPAVAPGLSVAEAYAVMSELGITHEQVYATLDACGTAPVDARHEALAELDERDRAAAVTVTFDGDSGADDSDASADCDGEPGDNDHGGSADTSGDADGLPEATPVAPPAAAPVTGAARWTFTWEGDTLVIAGPAPTTHPEVHELREALYRSGVARGLSSAWKGWPAAPLAAAVGFVMQRPCGSDDVSFLNWKLNAAARGSDPRVRLPAAAPAAAPVTGGAPASTPRTGGRAALPTGRAKATSYITFGMTDEAAAALDRFGATQGHGSRMATARAAFRAYFAAFGDEGAEVIEALGL
jgi:hypothetical protein